MIKVFMFGVRRHCKPALLVWAAMGLTVHPGTLHAGGIVSLNLCTDQLLVQLAPERVAGLEPMARDPALSSVAAVAQTMPLVRADAEAVLMLKPDLVLAGQYGAQTTLALLRSHGLSVLQLDDPQDFPAIAAQVTVVASLLGVPARGQALVARMWQRLGAIRRRSGTAVLWEAGGWTAGPGSLGAAVLHAAGLTNIGTGGRLGLEALLVRPPGHLVRETAPRFPSIATDLARHPALAGILRLDVPARLLICGGPQAAGAAEVLGR